MVESPCPVCVIPLRGKMPHDHGIMNAQASTVDRSTDFTDPILGALSEWQQDQFARHLRYARSLGLSPSHSERFALQQLQTAKAHQAASAHAQ